MVKRIAVLIVCLCLEACAAFCQGTGTGLPDAPSAVVAPQPDRSGSVGSSPLNLARDGMSGGFAGSGPTAFLPPRPALEYESVPARRNSGALFRKYLDLSSAKQHARYGASSKYSLMGRATDAAARIFVTQDESGRRRVNASYFAGMLTSIAVHNASRPYWARSNSIRIGDFGATVGNDAGMNLMHEFGPELRQAVAGHMPSFVFKFEKRIIRNVNPRDPH